MGIFGKSRQAPPAAAGHDLFTDAERERVDALWRLTALPGEEFDATYGGMLARCWRYVAAPEGERWTAVKSEALTCAAAALRVRQAHVLPRFAAAEDAARLAEAMSFALAVAVVAERFGLLAGRATVKDWCPLIADIPASATLDDRTVRCCYGALLVPRLVGDTGLGWLGQEPVVLNAMAAYFGPGPSELRAIAEEAERRVGLAIVRTPGSEGMPRNRTPRTRTPGPRPTPRRLRHPGAWVAKALAGGGSTGCATACAMARSPSTPRADGCTTSPAKRTWWCRTDSRNWRVSRGWRRKR